MTEYIVKQDKNGKARYYRVEDGKKTAIKKAEYEANVNAESEAKTEENTIIEEEKKMNSNYRQSRWTKVHAQGQGNFETKNNVMDITIGTGRAQADILYSTAMVRTIKKAAQWLLHSLEVAQANDVVSMAKESIMAKADETTRESEEMMLNGEGWSCIIENMGNGEFKAQLTWVFKEEQVEETTTEETTTEEATA